MNQLCYALLYTGDNNKILARTILLYKILKKYTKCDVIIVSDKFHKFEDVNFFIPEDCSKFNYVDKTYPNIYMKFSVYQLHKLGYTHCILIDTDVIVNYDLINSLKIFEKYIINNITVDQIAMHRYPIWEKKSQYHGSCLIFNIEHDLSDLLLNLKGIVDGWSTEEVCLTNYAIKYPHNIRDIPDGFICNIKEFSKFVIFKHIGSKLFYSSLSITNADDFNTYKKILSKIECKDSLI